ncbi:MAG: Uma2 family endonuclease [Candidatus Poribacteria bacterium]|nr:Uma2 family endonuclease [Candidatus Poribacteria bacterium]
MSEDQFKRFSVAPDLAIEVVSPADLHYDVTEKALAYLKAGTRLVWVIEPVMKTAMVYRSETDITSLNYKDTLTGEDVVEGFSCPVVELFE